MKAIYSIHYPLLLITITDQNDSDQSLRCPSAIYWYRITGNKR